MRLPEEVPCSALGFASSASRNARVGTWSLSSVKRGSQEHDFCIHCVRVH